MGATAKPTVIKDGALVTGDNGKPQYGPLIDFDSVAVRNAFSDAVVHSVLDLDPNASNAGRP